MEFQGYVHATPSVLDGVAYISGCDETFRGIRVADGREVLNVPVGAYMGASAALAGGAAYVGTFENEVIGIDMKARKVMWTYRHPERLFPYYSSAAISQGRVVLGGRDKMVHALDAKTGKALLDVHDQRARRVVSGHCRQSRLRRLDRRPALRAGSPEGRQVVGVRRRRGDLLRRRRSRTAG